MAVTSDTMPTSRERWRQLRTRLSQPFVMVPILGWFLGALAAVMLEQLIGLTVARALGLPRIPALFGVTIALNAYLFLSCSTLLSALKF